MNEAERKGTGMTPEICERCHASLAVAWMDVPVCDRCSWIGVPGPDPLANVCAAVRDITEIETARLQLPPRKD